MRPSIVVVGIHGHGAGHLENARRLDREGAIRLAGTVDLLPPAQAGIPHHADLSDVLREQRPDIVVLCTPLHTHAALATAALEGGCDILLEKPAVTSIAEFDAILATAEMLGRRVQVGFQSMGSAAIETVTTVIESGAIGEVTGYSAVGSWSRPLSYWNRNDWAGRRSLDGVPVVDGVVTNPLAHAVQLALALAGAGRDGVRSIELDQFRANRIEADDTSVIRIRTLEGLPVVCALTLCAPERSEPYVTVTGTEGRIRMYYTLDLVQVESPAFADPVTTHHGRTDLLRNLVAARSGEARLLCPLDDLRAFTQVVDAVRASPDPHVIPEEQRDLVGEGDERRVVVADVQEWVVRAAEQGRTFTELGVPWA